MNTYNSFNALVEGSFGFPQGARIAMELFNGDVVQAKERFSLENMSPTFDSAPSFRGFQFHNYSDELQHGGKLEPKHVHVRTPEGEAKFWLEHGDGSQVALAENKGVPDPIFRDIQRHIKKHRKSFIQDWNDWVSRNDIQGTGQ